MNFRGKRLFREEKATFLSAQKMASSGNSPCSYPAVVGHDLSLLMGALASALKSLRIGGLEGEGGRRLEVTLSHVADPASPE